MYMIESRSFNASSSLLLRLLLPRDKGLAVARADAHVGKDLLWSKVNGGDVGGLVGNLLLEFLRAGVSIYIPG